MPNRLGVELIDIASFDNLAGAFYLAARGKRSRPAVQRFARDLDQQLNQLGDDVIAESYVPEPMREFIVRDPKRRLIHAPAFRDRVLHHAIMRRIDHHLDNTLIDDSFACRLGKGAIAAVQRAQFFSRRHPWFVKTDIRQYFHSIDHGLLKDRLYRRFKGNAFLRLLYALIDAFESQPGIGLPIGALTSQAFANLYLNDFDRWLGARAQVRGLVRYMDDVVCWFDNKHAARQCRFALADFLRDELALSVGATQLNRSDAGLSFCGHRVFPGIVRITHGDSNVTG